MLGTISAEPSYDLTETDPARQGLIRMLEGNSTNPVKLPHLFPKFLKVIIGPQLVRVLVVYI